MPSPHGYGHSAQVECRSIVDDGPHVLGVFGAGPTSRLLWGGKIVVCVYKWLGVYNGVDTNSVTVLETHSKPVF